MEIIAGTGIFIVQHANELVGLIIPPFVEWLNREVKNSNERFIVTLIVCFIVSVIIKWDNIVYGTPQAAAATLGLLFLESQLIFRLYFKNSWLRTQIKTEGDGGVVEAFK